nr:uncharacterized protein LOC112758449 isoform X1 [Arachis hypogaea]
MFSFVMFIDPQTVKTILDKGSMLVEFSTLYYSSHHIDMDSEMNSIPRSCGNARSLKRQLMEEQEQALELVEIQKRCLAALQFAQNFLSTSPHFRFSINGMRASEGNRDNASWRFSSDGKYNVKSFINVAEGKIYGEPTMKHVFDDLWRGLVPPRIEMLVWFVITDGLSTKDKLIRRES